MKSLLILAFCLAVAPLRAAFEGGAPTHALLIAGGGVVAELTPKGDLMRQWRVGNVNDAWRLPNGNVLVADGAAWEATPAGKRIWEYKSTEGTGGGVFSCQRLPNGNTLIAENSTGRIFERTADGRDLNLIQVPLNEQDRHQTLRMVRRLPNGETLVCRSGVGIVERYGANGKLVWSQKVEGLAFAAVQDPAGNVYVSLLDRIQLWSPDHKLLWEFVGKDSGLPIKNMTGLHLLPNGNLLVGCYACGPKDIGAFEVTPRKSVLWRYTTPERGRDSHMAIQLLDPAIVTPNR